MIDFGHIIYIYTHTLPQQYTIVFMVMIKRGQKSCSCTTNTCICAVEEGSGLFSMLLIILSKPHCINVAKT